MEKFDFVIHPKWIITCEENNTTLENHALVVKNGLIHAILPSPEARKNHADLSHHDYKTHAVMPGLINSHTHIGMNLFRGLADDLALMDWLNDHIWPAERQWVSHELVKDASMIAMAEMIRSGTTCFNEMYFFLGATAQAAEVAGLRAHIGITVIDFPTAWAATSDEYFDKGLAFYHQYKDHPLITATLAPHSTYTVCDENLLRVKALSDAYQLKINIHLQEAHPEVQQSIDKMGKRPVKHLYDLGLLSPNLMAIHMTQISDDDAVILQATKPNIVHCPESNMKLASGACPVEKLTQLGLNVALGTDSVASNNDLDMISEMRSATLLAKLTAGDPKALSAEKTLQMATRHGAKALGISEVTGTLTKGKSADFIAINLDEIETQPLYHPSSQIVYSASRNQVTDVWVAGRQLLKNRELTTLDEKELLAKAQIWRNKIKS